MYHIIQKGKGFGFGFVFTQLLPLARNKEGTNISEESPVNTIDSEIKPVSANILNY